MAHKTIFFVCMYVMFVSSSMIQAFSYLIDSKTVYNLADIKQQIQHIKFEDIVLQSFVNADKNATLQRKGIVVRKPNALGTVIICHGYLGCKRDALALKHLFPLYNIVVFDFRAHGDDKEGQFSTIGRDEAFDVIAAVQFVKSDPDMANKPIIAFGYSMGAVSAIQAQAIDETLFDAMILDCPFASTDESMRRGLEERMKFSIFGNQFTIPGKQFLLDHMYDQSAQAITNFLFKKITKLDSKKVATKFVRVMPIESIKKITIPCFFIHCENDQKVTIADVESLYNNKPGFKRLWITQGKAHFGSYQNNPELYWYKVNKFLTKLRERNMHDRDQEKVCDHRTKVTIANNVVRVEMNNGVKQGRLKVPMRPNVVTDQKPIVIENMMENLM